MYICVDLLASGLHILLVMVSNVTGIQCMYICVDLLASGLHILLVMVVMSLEYSVCTFV